LVPDLEDAMQDDEAQPKKSAEVAEEAVGEQPKKSQEAAREESKGEEPTVEVLLRDKYELIGRDGELNTTKTLELLSSICFTVQDLANFGTYENVAVDYDDKNKEVLYLTWKFTMPKRVRFFY